MTFTVFSVILAICAAVTSLLVQGVKSLLNRKKVNYSANVLVLIVAVIVGCSVTALYYVNYQIPFNALNSVYLALMGIANWLGAMFGYDKVRQTIEQIKQIKGI